MQFFMACFLVGCFGKYNYLLQPGIFHGMLLGFKL